MAEAIRTTDAERAAVIFYGLTLFVISVIVGALRATVARDRELLQPEVTEDEVNVLLLRTTPGLGFYAAVIAVAIVAPQLAAFGYLVIAIVAVANVRSTTITQN